MLGRPHNYVDRVYGRRKSGKRTARLKLSHSHPLRLAIVLITTAVEAAHLVVTENALEGNGEDGVLASLNRGRESEPDHVRNKINKPFEMIPRERKCEIEAKR